jgi:hypothetical protein
MNNSSDASNPEAEAPSAKQLPVAEWQLPVDPNFKSTPPKGTWEDGYWLSVAALEEAEKHPEIWEERRKRMCTKEFVW